ncbi:carbohydrate ABC transporter permease [Rhodovibrionaceae bacterium A322]
MSLSQAHTDSKISRLPGSGFSWNSWQPYLLLAPALLFLSAFTYWPLVQVFFRSLSAARRGSETSGELGLESYQRLFADGDFLGALLNNGIYALGTVVPSVVLALFFALALRRSTRLNGLFRSLLFFPTLIPLVAAAALFIFVFMPGIGLLDYYLAKLGVASINWLGNPDLALTSLMAITVWKNAGYYMLFFLAGLQSLPEDAEEAAVLEGASALQRLWYVTLPLLGPTTAFVVVIALISAISQVDHVIVMTQGGPNNATNLLLYYIYQQAHEFYDLGKATAATVVTLSLLLAVSVVSLRTMERGIHYEA